MKIKLFGLFATLVAILTFSSVSFAQDTQSQDAQPKMERGGRRGKIPGMRGHGDGHRGGRMLRLMSELNLTDEQKQQSRSIFENFQNSTKAQREEMRQIFGQKRDGGTLTSEQEARARELGAQLREAAKKLDDDLLAILTPEQRQQLEQKREEMRLRHQEHRQMKQKGETQPQI